MARSRNIKPDLFKDTELAELPIEARYLFPGLWCLADCEGRLTDEPKRIKAEIYPYDAKISAARVHELLQLLADAEFIVRYQAGNKRFIQVINFKKHQNPHKKERDKGSEIPGPAPVATVPKPGPAPENPEPSALIPDSLNLIPDSGFPQTATPEKNGVALRVSERFEEFWERYPRKAGKDATAREWSMYVTAGNEALVFDCLENYLASADVSRGAIMNAGSSNGKLGWLALCAKDDWACRWPPGSNPHNEKSFRASVERVIQGRAERGEQLL